MFLDEDGKLVIYKPKYKEFSDYDKLNEAGSITKKDSESKVKIMEESGSNNLTSLTLLNTIKVKRN